MTRQDARASVCVSICTVDRNGALLELLRSLRAAADHSAATARVGIAIIDDHPDGVAKAVIPEVADWFEAGVHYVNPGSRDLATARNTAIETGVSSADYVGFIDDDCVAPVDWFDQHLGIHREYGCDVTTGPFRYVVPPGGPAWLTTQPILANAPLYEDGSIPPFGSTANVLWRSAWLVDHPKVRVRASLGRAGGEDMVFYGDARAQGAHHRYARQSLVFEHLTTQRSTYRYQLRQHYWLGNSEAVTNLQKGTASRVRLAVRGARRGLTAVSGPLIRIARGRAPFFRLASIQFGEAAGLVIGACGVVLHHH